MNELWKGGKTVSSIIAGPIDIEIKLPGGIVIR